MVQREPVIDREFMSFDFRQVVAVLGPIKTIDLIADAIGEHPISSYDPFDLHISIQSDELNTYIEILNGNNDVVGWVFDEPAISLLGA